MDQVMAPASQAGRCKGQLQVASVVMRSPCAGAALDSVLTGEMRFDGWS
jgi:hypothetical protein